MTDTFHQWRTPREDAVDQAPASDARVTHVADDYAAIAARMRELGQAGEAADHPGIPSFSQMGPVGPAEPTLGAAISSASNVYIQGGHTIRGLYSGAQIAPSCPVCGGTDWRYANVAERECRPCHPLPVSVVGTPVGPPDGVLAATREISGMYIQSPLQQQGLNQAYAQNTQMLTNSPNMASQANAEAQSVTDQREAYMRHLQSINRRS
jgi:hypothetical protein